MFLHNPKECKIINLTLIIVCEIVEGEYNV